MVSDLHGEELRPRETSLDENRANNRMDERGRPPSEPVGIAACGPAADPFNDEVWAETEISGLVTAVVWCRAFGALTAIAPRGAG